MKRLLALLLFPLVAIAAVGQSGKSSVVDGPIHDGQAVTCDLYPAQQFRNIGSHLDGAGMCVFTSIEMAARFHGLEEMRGFRDWWASVSRGGGWPEQVDKSLAAWGKHKGITIPPYYQYEGKDPGKILELIDRTGRMACITYGQSPRYGKGTIAHMVCCPRYRGDLAVVLDNNFVAKRSGDTWDEHTLEWMPKTELVRRMSIGGAWAFCWLTPPPPPPARNLVLPKS